MIVAWIKKISGLKRRRLIHLSVGPNICWKLVTILRNHLHLSTQKSGIHTITLIFQ